MVNLAVGDVKSDFAKACTTSLTKVVGPPQALQEAGLGSHQLFDHQQSF